MRARDRVARWVYRHMEGTVRRAAEAGYADGKPMEREGGYWVPKLGDLVWLNYPDSKEPEGRVIGFVAKGYKREGQPIIERIRDEPPVAPFERGFRKGDRVVIHPSMLLPFAFGSKEWKKAEAEGRVG